MSATLGYDVGLTLVGALAYHDHDLVESLDARRPTWRRAGLRRPYWECAALRLRLPPEAGKAYRLMVLCRTVQAGGLAARDAAGRLGDKLRLALGLPDCHIEGEECGFLDAVREAPVELATWAAYGDWLTEREGDRHRRRGLVIQGWLSGRPMKVKGGVPVLAFAGTPLPPV